MDKFTALAEPTRRKILELLASQGELSATELYQHFQVSPPAISQHLKILREADWVRVEKRAQQRIYRINAAAMLEIEVWARGLRQVWNQRLDALERVLMQEQERILAMNKADQINGIKEVTLERTFDAPRQLVYQAWTDPRLVSQWWGPETFTTALVEMDVRTGGALRIDMQGPDGSINPMTGVFEEVVPNERLVFTSNAFEDETGQPQLAGRNTVTFSEQDGRTLITVHAVILRATPALAGALAGMKQGWSESLDRLNRVLKA